MSSDDSTEKNSANSPSSGDSPTATLNEVAMTPETAWQLSVNRLVSAL